MIRSTPRLIVLALLAVALVPVAFTLGFEPRRPLPASTAPGALVLAVAIGLGTYILGALYTKRIDRYESALALDKDHVAVIGVLVGPDVTRRLGEISGRKVHLPNRAQLLIFEDRWEIEARGAYTSISFPTESIQAIELHRIPYHRGTRTAISAVVKGLSAPLTLPVATINGETREGRIDDFTASTRNPHVDEAGS